MDEKKSNDVMLADVAYHNYLAVLCHIDAEWSRTQHKDIFSPFRDVQDEVRSSCAQYVNAIRSNYNAYSKANRIEPGPDVAPYLFQPRFYIPFGHSDTLAIVLLDDFEAVHHLTLGMKTTLEELSIGFCPKISSLGAKTGDRFLCNVHEILENSTDEAWPSSSEATASFDEHPIGSLPLLAFTKYKMDGLGAIGFGLLFQQALLKAIIRRLRETIQSLRESCLGESNKDAQGLYSIDDVETVRCALLDLQGSEEIGTLLFCKNYTVALSLIAALRSITFRDVYEVSPEVHYAFASSPAHRSIVRLCTELKGLQITGSPDAIEDNHVFRWTNTSLSVSPAEFFGAGESRSTGYVGAFAEVKIAPGHELNVPSAQTLLPGNPVSDSKLNQESSSRHRREIDTSDLNDLYFYKIGVGDILLSYGTPFDRFDTNLMPLDELLLQIRVNFEKFATRNGDFKRARDVVDLQTEIIIPVSRSLFRPLAHKHIDALGAVLPHVQHRLCYPEKTPGREWISTSGCLDINILKKIPRQYGVPVQLRRTLEYLFINFAALLKDPFLFDIVIDLYDSFATFHVTLTEHLKNQRFDELERGNQNSVPAMDEMRTRQIAQFVDALHNALSHRMMRAYPEGIERDMAIDFRGGLNQVFFAADAPFKCGLGLLRKYVLSGNQPGRGDTPRNRVGGVTYVTSSPGMRLYSLRLGVESHAKLTMVEADVPHVLHVASYCDYLHEAAHLIFEHLIETKELDVEIISNRSEVMAERISEVFVAIVLNVFVYSRGGSEIFLYHNITAYAMNQSSVRADDGSIIQQYAELFLRLFVAVDSIPDDIPRCDWPKYQWGRENESWSVTYDRFCLSLESASGFMPEYERLWRGPNSPGQMYSRSLFGAIYPALALIMPKLWKAVMIFFDRFYTAALRVDGIPESDRQEDIRGVVIKSFTEGRPVCRSTPRDLIANLPLNDLDESSVDALVVICEMLRSYVAPIVHAKDKAIHLERLTYSESPENAGHIVFREKTRKWHEFQIDSGATAMFCPVPEARGKRLVKQIAMLKSFWDIASNLRARRLTEILNDNWINPDPGPEVK